MIDAQGLDAKIWVLGEAYYSIDCDYLLPAILAVSKLRAKAARGLFKALF
ncbi:MAG: sodium:solute symporter [Campylobacter sp.]